MVPNEFATMVAEAKKALRTRADQGDIESQVKYGEAVFDLDREEARRYFQLAAEKGSVGARLRLGQAWLRSGEVERATKLLAEAAQAGSPEADYELGLFYLDNDKPKAANHFKKAADAGLVEAMRSFAFMRLSGEGVEANVDEGGDYLNRSINESPSLGRNNLSNTLASSPRDSEQARRYFEILNNREVVDVESRISLAGMLFEGVGGPIDRDRAFKLLEKEADPRICLVRGKMREKNNEDTLAILDYEKAGDYPPALYALGMLYMSKLRSQPRHMEKAVTYFRRGAEASDPSCCNAYGFALAHGIGVAQNAKEAVPYFEKAISKGLPAAMFNLGLMCLTGTGVEKDPGRGISLLKQGAELGDPVAMAQLGEAYESGRGVAVDLKEARRWYEQAAAEGFPFALERLAALSRSEKPAVVAPGNDDAPRSSKILRP